MDYTTFHTADLDRRRSGPLLNSIVIPRPIAWVSSLSAEGIANLAPFSYFNAVSPLPMTVMVSVGRRGEQRKDTLQNVEQTREFVVHTVDETHAQVMNLSSGDWLPDQDEFEMVGLEKTPALVVKPPRIAAALVALECTLSQLIPVQDSPYTLMLGQVQVLHIRSDLLAADGFVDAKKLQPLARMGRTEYATLGKIIEIHRPQV